MTRKTSAERAEEVAAALFARIADGELTRRLPSQSELADVYNETPHVIHRAVRQLAQAGHVVVLQGRGAWVRPPDWRT